MANQTPAILDDKGQAIPPRGTREHQRYMALNGGSMGGWTPYDAASRTSDEMALWNPGLFSADTEINPYRDRIVSRVRDLVRNDGWASGATTRILDNVVGANLRPIFRPDYRFLQAMTGNKASTINGRMNSAASRMQTIAPGRTIPANGATSNAA
jgi:capsid protein